MLADQLEKLDIVRFEAVCIQVGEVIRGDVDGCRVRRECHPLAERDHQPVAGIEGVDETSAPGSLARGRRGWWNRIASRAKDANRDIVRVAWGAEHEVVHDHAVAVPAKRQIEIDECLVVPAKSGDRREGAE